MTGDDFTANAAVAINSNRKQVWDALVSAAAIRQYMGGTEVDSLWHEGSNIAWKGEFKGKRYEDKGVILKLEPETLLKFSHFSPLSGKHDEPDNYQVITIMLADGADRTEVALTQENNEDEQARLESVKNWSAVLEGLKKYVEES